MGEWFYLGLAAAGVYLPVTLVAIWAGWSKRHWFLRFAVVGGVLSLGLTIPAYDAVLVFLIHSVIVIAVLTVVKRRHARAAAKSGDVTHPPARLQFSLRDLLLAMVIVSAVCALLANVPAALWAEWPALLLFGGSFAATTFAFVAIAVGPVRRKVPSTEETGGRRGWTRYPLRRKMVQTEEVTGRRRIVWDMLATGIMLLVLFNVIVAAGVYYRVINPPPIPKAALPDPNGYDTLIQAGRPLENVTVPDAQTATLPVLRAFLTTYGHVLEAARVGLGQESRIPLTYSPADDTSPFISRCKQIGRAFIVEGKLAEAEGRGADAAESYLDAIRLGDLTPRGGLLVHSLLGWALKQKGMNSLYEMRNTLTRDQCRELIDTLRAIEAEQEPLEDLLTRETRWLYYDGSGKEGRAVAVFASSELIDFDRERAQFYADFHKARVRLLICELALRMYRVQHGGPPRELADLVPDFLPAVPEDPFSGKPLIYRPRATGYLLYSVGPNRRDDDGQPLNDDTDLGRSDVRLGEIEK